MIEIQIPGRGPLRLAHLVLDWNGTLALDGALLDGVTERLVALSAALEIHVVTADTHGDAAQRVAELPVRLEILPAGEQDERKRAVVERLDAPSVAAMGNGANDHLMLAEAGLGVGIVGPEGMAGPTIAAADVVVGSIGNALDLLAIPTRLVATLRN